MEAAIRKRAVKMDWIAMTWQHRVFQLTMQQAALIWFYPQFGGDSSPQKLFDYFNGIENRYIFEDTFEDDAKCALTHGPLTCFDWVRRTMVPQVLGYGEGSVADKWYRFNKTLLLESGDVNGSFLERRGTCSCWLADQGVDLKAGDVPAPTLNTLDLMM